MPNYGDPKYWDKRYRNNSGSMFDWLEDYNSLKSMIKELANPESKVLILGCGNAEFSEHMYDDGYKNIYNIDISTVVIKQMRKRNEQREGMVYEVMDVCDMTYPDGYFDIAIDKSTIDALLCGDNAFLNVARMTKEVQRVLKPGGVYFVISYGKPENRDFHLEREHLSFTLKEYALYPSEAVTEEQKEEKSHYIYICTKKEDADRVSAENFEKVCHMLNKQAEEESLLQTTDD